MARRKRARHSRTRRVRRHRRAAVGTGQKIINWFKGIVKHPISRAAAPAIGLAAASTPVITFDYATGNSPLGHLIQGAIWAQQKNPAATEELVKVPTSFVNNVTNPQVIVTMAVEGIVAGALHKVGKMLGV